MRSARSSQLAIALFLAATLVACGESKESPAPAEEKPAEAAPAAQAPPPPSPIPQPASIHIEIFAEGSAWPAFGRRPE